MHLFYKLSMDSLYLQSFCALSWIPCPEVFFPCFLKSKSEPLNHKGAEIPFLISFSASVDHKKAWQSGSQVPFLETRLFLVAFGLAKLTRAELSSPEAEGRKP